MIKYIVFEKEEGKDLKKTVVTIGTAAVVIFTSTFTSGPMTVSAERNINSLKTEQRNLNKDLSKVETKIKDILLDIQEIHKEITQLESEIKENQKLIKDVQDQIKAHEQEIAIINERIDERTEILKNRISSFQQAGGNVSFLEVILGAKNPLELISRLDAVTTMIGADQELIDEQDEDLQKVELKVDELTQMKADFEGINDQLEYDIEEQEKAKKKIANKEKELKKEKNKIEGNLQSVNNSIAALEAEVRASMNTTTIRAQRPVSKASSNLPQPNVDTSSVLATARSASGVPYRSAGSSLSGFDCSGYVSWVYGQHGVSLPRTASGMGQVGTRVPSLSQAQPGDLVIFRRGGHVGIYIGNGKFIGSQSSTGVAVADMTSGYWARNFDGNIRRVK